jgi:hypothetical protein
MYQIGTFIWRIPSDILKSSKDLRAWYFREWRLAAYFKCGSNNASRF